MLMRMEICAELQRDRLGIAANYKTQTIYHGGYPARAKLIADRRVFLAGYRMAEMLERTTSNELLLTTARHKSDNERGARRKIEAA